MNLMMREPMRQKEELIMLKEMKVLKRNYKDNYDKLMNMKVDINDIQSNIGTNTSLIFHFEDWY